MPRSAEVSPRHVLVLVSIGAFLATVDAPIVSVAMPALARHFPATRLDHLSWVLDGYVVAFAAMLLTTGRLADRWSRRRFLIGGLVVFAIASVACALAPTANWLIAARVGQALGGGAILPAGQAILLGLHPPERRYRAIMTLGMIVALGVALAPTIGGLVIQVADWQVIFWGSAGIAAVAAAWGMRVLPPLPGDRAVRMPDPVGTVAQGAALALLVFAILGIHRFGLADPRVLISALIAIAGGALAVHRSSWHPSPSLHFDLLVDPVILRANLASAAIGAGLFSYSLAAVYFLSQAWGYGTLDVGLSFVPGATASVIGGRLAPRLAARYGAPQVGYLAALASALGFALLVALPGRRPEFLTTFIPGQILVGLGMTAALTTAVALSLVATPVPRLAAGSGLNGALRQIGGAIGVATVAAIFAGSPTDPVAAAHRAWAFAAVAMIAGAAALLSLVWRGLAATAPADRPRGAGVARSAPGLAPPQPVATIVALPAPAAEPELAAPAPLRLLTFASGTRGAGEPTPHDGPS